MVIIKEKQGPHEIKNPKIKKRLIKIATKSLKMHSLAKKDFKYMFYHLFHIYPNGRQGSAWINDIVKTEEDRKALADMKLLTREEHYNPNTQFRYYMYGLGHQGLSLISTWNVEKMTKWIIGLTITIVFLSICTLLLAIFS